MGNFTIVAIDVSGDGRLSWPPSTQSADSPTLFHDITIFLTSESQSNNFTISNGTTPPTNSSGYVGPVLDLEPSSTVKHVNWIWPECFVGTGTDDNSRGEYNISIHQSFRWNSTDYYTVFDLPISVTNSISESSDRVECASLENKMVTEDQESSNSLPGQPWLDGNYTSTQISSPTSTSTSAGVAVQRQVVMAAVGTALCMFWQLMG
ncbi:hypothetical protein N7493_008358 [Penicillium malachiteum]|uniref:Uncharacterized protein n=1 Tax=Penicillium malachiteum TaxID=1324776 RepID=A0AAD6HHH8_9EURO|nr:hypothetical protein N7493_008358 [Penicillium malachiteum]